MVEKRISLLSILKRNTTSCLLVLVFACFSVILLQSAEPSPLISLSVPFSDIDAVLLKNVTETLNTGCSKSCMELAREYPEPYTEQYENQKIELDGPMYAYYRWKRNIYKVEIEAQKTAKVPDCRIVFKVIDRSLYVYHESECYTRMNTEESSHLKTRFNRQVELILLALEIYDVPDVDFVIELADGPFPAVTKNQNIPGLAYCIKAGVRKNAGFTYPSYDAYAYSLGRTQLQFFQACQRIKYPFSRRTVKAVWRGSTTGKALNRASDVYTNRRISLAHIGNYMKDTLDVGIVDYVQANESSDDVRHALQGLAPIQDRLSTEQYSSYAVVIDLDGNAWSDRLPRLLTSETPVLKQEYDTWIEYFGHLLTDREVTFFRSDLSDIVQVTNGMLSKYRSRRRKWEAQIAQANEFAAEHLSHLGVIRAMAYALTKQASLQNWDVTSEPGYIEIPRAVCCHLNPSLPQELTRRMKS